YSDRYGDVYAYRHCDIHTDGDCHRNRNRYGNCYSYSYSNGNSYSYSYANANAASCADCIERYQPDCHQLYCELDQCPWCEQLPVRRIREQYFWHVPDGIPRSACQRDQSKRDESDCEHVLLLPGPVLQRQYKWEFQRHQSKD